MPDNIPYLFNQGVKGWLGYSPSGSSRGDSIITHDIMSRVATALPDGPLFVTGSVSEEDHALEIQAVGPTLIARARRDSDSDSDSWIVDVQPLSRMTSIRIDASPDATSGVIGSQRNETHFTLLFDWGAVVVDQHHGSEQDRREWLRTFLELLAA